MPTYLRFCIGKRIYNGGWHFSFIGDEKFILNKAMAIAETQYINARDESTNVLEEKINKNIQTFKKTQFCLKISNVFPKYFLQNIDKYEKFICKERQIPYWVAFLYIYCIKILKALRLY